MNLLSLEQVQLGCGGFILEEIMNWIQRKVYLYNVTFGLYMLDFWERALFSIFLLILLVMVVLCHQLKGIYGAVLWEERLIHTGDDRILTFAPFICGEFWCKDCIGPQDVLKEVEKICRNFDGLPPQALSAKHIWVMACKKDDLVGKVENRMRGLQTEGERLQCNTSRNNWKFGRNGTLSVSSAAVVTNGCDDPKILDIPELNCREQLECVETFSDKLASCCEQDKDQGPLQ
ncbi:hypothetical protein Cgig2_026035 [Carnegiea gigantea]|uniref:Uncharacterized protein n=1 Tax=Carnegiea gigantea TaxID=171969 RepID=A0A9Q1QK77_9CARY|nr:hypothetical protein Cgig2_026035 [Carnegiea gigantea]